MYLVRKDDFMIMDVFSTNINLWTISKNPKKSNFNLSNIHIVALKDGTHPAKNPFHFKIIQINGDFSKPKHADNDA